MSKETTPLVSGDDGSLESGGVVQVFAWRRIGYLAQYFSVGLIYGGLPATQYGLFIAYLNAPAYISSAASALSTFPWSMKIIFAIISDCFPIYGYRRIPYMAGGWAVTAVFLIALAALNMPKPYHCFGTGGSYNTSAVCNPEAQTEVGMTLAVLMFFCAIGYVQADVAADALTVQYARREPLATRGRTQTTAYLVRQVGVICAQLLVGLGMNGKEYNGTFDHALSFNAICGILAVPAVLMVPTSLFLVEESRLITPDSSAAAKAGKALSTPLASTEGSTFNKEDGAKGPGEEGSGPKEQTAGTKGAGAQDGEEEEEIFSLEVYRRKAGMLLCSGAVCEVFLFQFLSSVIGSIATTAGPEVQLYWAEVQNLQNQLFSIAGNLLFVIGLWVVSRYFLNVSWRAMLAFTLIAVNVIDAPFTFCTIFDVVRNQYFFLDDSLMTSLPSAMSFVVSTYINVEMAEKGNEGLTYGLFSTATNVGTPLATTISNAAFGAFRPSLSDSANYVKDSPSFRNLVALSYVLSYAFSFASLVLLPLMPNQKADAAHRKATRPRGKIFAVITISILVISILYSLTFSLLAVIPSTSCLAIAGGPGCSH